MKITGKRCPITLEWRMLLVLLAAFLLQLTGAEQVCGAPSAEKKIVSDVKVSSEVLMVWKDKDGKVHSKLVQLPETDKSYLVKESKKELKKQG